jgi:hypothetical protein
MADGLQIVIEFLADVTAAELHPPLTYDAHVPVPLVGENVELNGKLYEVTAKTIVYRNDGNAIKVSLRCKKAGSDPTFRAWDRRATTKEG